MEQKDGKWSASFYKADGQKVEVNGFHTRKSLFHDLKRRGVEVAYVVDPEGNKTKERFEPLPSVINHTDRTPHTFKGKRRHVGRN